MRKCIFFFFSCVCPFLFVSLHAFFDSFYTRDIYLIGMNDDCVIKRGGEAWRGYANFGQSLETWRDPY